MLGQILDMALYEFKQARPGHGIIAEFFTALFARNPRILLSIEFDAAFNCRFCIISWFGNET